MPRPESIMSLPPRVSIVSLPSVGAGEVQYFTLGHARGLGLLDLTTTMTADKQLRYVTGVETASGARISGYEMHLGLATGPATANPFIRFDNGTTDGAHSPNGRILGCHIHGLFNDTAFRQAFLATLGAQSLGNDYSHRIEHSLDTIAATLARTLDVHEIRQIAGLLS